MFPSFPSAYIPNSNWEKFPTLMGKSFKSIFDMMGEQYALGHADQDDDIVEELKASSEGVFRSGLQKGGGSDEERHAG